MKKKRKPTSQPKVGSSRWLDALAEKLARRADELDGARATDYQDEIVRRSLIVAFSELSQMLRADTESASNGADKPRV